MQSKVAIYITNDHIRRQNIALYYHCTCGKSTQMVNLKIPVAKHTHVLRAYQHKEPGTVYCHQHAQLVHS